jgi:hypothetical protein
MDGGAGSIAMHDCVRTHAAQSPFAAWLLQGRAVARVQKSVEPKCWICDAACAVRRGCVSASPRSDHPPWRVGTHGRVRPAWPFKAMVDVQQRETFDRCGSSDDEQQ